MIFEIHYKVGTQEGTTKLELDPTLTAGKAIRLIREHLAKEHKLVTGNRGTMSMGDRDLGSKDVLTTEHGSIIVIQLTTKNVTKKPKPRQAFAAQAKLALEGNLAQCSKRWLFANADKIEAVTHALEFGSKLPVVATEEGKKTRMPTEKNVDDFFEYQAGLAFKGKIKECDMQWLFENAEHIEPIAKRLKIASA
jgi:hypothetical protein